MGKPSGGVGVDTRIYTRKQLQVFIHAGGRCSIIHTESACEVWGGHAVRKADVLRLAENLSRFDFDAYWRRYQQEGEGDWMHDFVRPAKVVIERWMSKIEGNAALTTPAACGIILSARTADDRGALQVRTTLAVAGGLW